MEVLTSEDRFWVACPCAQEISRYVSALLDPEGLSWGFGKAVVRRSHTSALFVCVGPRHEAQELWVSAQPDGDDGWWLQHTPLAPWSG